MKVIDVAWAAGFLEGEGSFAHARSAVVAAPQIQREPLEQLQRLFGGPIYERRTPKGKIIHVWQIYSRNAAALMMTIYPLMSPKRQEQISKVLQVWRSKGLHSRDKTHCPSGHLYDKLYQAKDPTLRIQRYRYCRVCHNAAAQRWAEKNPERQKEIMESYYRRRKERSRETGVKLSEVRLNGRC